MFVAFHAITFERESPESETAVTKSKSLT